jgi:quercetin dioxygenase-like cupin family protein
MTTPKSRLVMAAADNGETAGFMAPEPSPADAIRAAAAIDLDAAMAGLVASPEWQTEPRSSSALLHTPELRVVLTALHAGATMHNDDPDETMTLHAVRGAATITINDDAAELREGSLLCVPAGAAWELNATTDAVVLLTVVRN